MHRSAPVLRPFPMETRPHRAYREGMPGSRAGTRLLAVLVMVALAILRPMPQASASEPRLSVTAAQTAARMQCTGKLATSRHKPVLFLHGTNASSRASWSWTWDRALDARKWAHCDLDLPASGNADLQVSAEYVVWAIRLMHQRSGRKISIVGHDQGGMLARWSLKYWPSTRKLVDDYVALSPSNHGSAPEPQCSVLGSCSAAAWQQQANSRFLAALNRGHETWPGISYTAITTRYDELVRAASTFLDPAANVANVTVQELCPTETVEHLGMVYDNAAWLIGLDALTHAGPARLGRINPSTCGQPLMPAVDPLTFTSNATMARLVSAQASVSAVRLPAEPRLKCYATSAC